MTGARTPCTGSFATIDEVFAEHYARLVRALAISHGVDDAAEAVQDAFAAALRQWPKIREYDDPGGWIRHVAINNLRSRRRNEARRQAILRRWRRPDGQATLGADPSIEAEARLDLHRAICALPEKQRMAIALYYLAELPIAEVAATLKVSQGTVKSNLHDARTSLLAYIGETYDQTRA